MDTTTKPAIPRRLDEVTADWLTQVLARSHPGVEVTRVTTEGFMGYKPNKARLAVEYNAAGERAGLPASFIVKGGFKGGSDGGEKSGLDIGVELELLAYQELTPILDVNTPRCFFVTFDPVSYDGIMLLEDLAPSGATFLHGATSLTYAQSAAFLDAQARFHAQWLDSSEFAAGGRFGPESPLMERTRRLHTLYLDQLVRPAYWDTFIAQPRGATLPGKLRDAARMAAAQARMNEIHGQAGQTLIHGDEHLGNLYLDGAGRPGLLDWCARREPWVLAFTYFLLSTTDALDRRAWEKPLLALYLDRLTRYGARAPGFEEAWFLYRGTTIYPMLTWLNNSGKWQPESVNTRNTARAALAVMDHDALELLGA